MTTAQFITNPIIFTDDDFSRLEAGEAQCQSCQNWHDMNGCESLVEYDCQFCESKVLAPMKISEFWLYGLTGEGGMGRVYVAQTQGDETIYAIKLSEYASEDDFHFQSLLYEGEIVMELDHEHIVKTHRFGYKAGKAFLLMDFIPGDALDVYIQDKAPTEGDIINWMSQLVEALHYLGEKNLLYRDLKPQNIMVHENTVTLVDFGLAMHLDHASDIDEENLVGSPSYIPPERINGQPEDFRSDIYSLGMLFYYIATGHDYFQGTPQEIVNYHAQDFRYPGSEVLKDFSPEFQTVFDAMINPDPESRYQNYVGLFDDLQILKDNLEVGQA